MSCFPQPRCCPSSYLSYPTQVYLPPRDDAAEFDDGGVDLAGHADDREVVTWRKSNKVSQPAAQYSTSPRSA